MPRLPIHAPRIKLPSGGLDVFITGDGDTMRPGFDAIVAISQMARTYWPVKSANGLPHYAPVLTVQLAG